ncbi:MAG TPA: hypothetical protein DIC53_06435 [Synergistaceae bacterium]|nr:hypothetical protein [Synergistaceae bacterium]
MTMKKIVRQVLAVLFLAGVLSLGGGFLFSVPAGADTTKTLPDGQTVHQNEVLYNTGAQMPSAEGISLQRFEDIWRNIAKATGFSAFVMYDEAEEINAYITIDNSGNPWVVVQRGLLDLLRTDDELAGVLAHETGHGIKEHVQKSAQRNTGIAVAASVLSHLLGAGDLGNILIGGGAMLAINGYSREQEVEADDYAVEYSYKAGYSPWGIYNAIERMADAGLVTPPSGFNSHPPTERRMSRLKAQAERWEKSGTVTTKEKKDTTVTDTGTVTKTGTSTQTKQPAAKPAPAKTPTVKSPQANTSDQIEVIDSYAISAGERNNLKILQRNGVTKFNAGRYREALDIFTRAANGYDGNYLAAYWAAKSARKIGNRTLTMNWIDKTLDINPEYVPAKQLRAEYMK